MRLAKTDKPSATNKDMDNYIISILKDKQSMACICGKKLDKGYQIHHKRYGHDITVYDLELLCMACHGMRHDRANATGLCRA